MARLLTILVLFGLLTLAVSGQSGRVKKKPDSEKESAEDRYVPTQNLDPGPTPTPKELLPPPPPPSDGEVINIESNLVPIPVSVVDRTTGTAVGGLRIPDFELKVDGKTVVIDDLYKSESPVRLALLFDNSSSVTVAREFEQTAAIRFFRRVIRPEVDLASLFSVAGVALLEQSMTKEVSRLISAIRNLGEPKGATSLHDAIVTASNYLQDFDGRRVIVIVSDGQDTLSDYTFDEMVRIVQQNNCQVYIVHTNEFENYKRTGRRTGSANLRALAAERRMQDLAAQTGGEVYSPIDEKELDRAFAQISVELTTQYILGYYPEAETRDDRFREIELTVRSDKDLIVRTRKGYYVR
ncbi:MAG: VWA domain-containing protein [Acidobacteria bacterium]|nr:MAG: VWA domain-containing protein [Acidobacteriota bacterium]REJ97977.1 MAG: VWA domain-containing protein [Acidobacteriota bacterium]REK16720.1 MAG: VWA domain-containing protein [Acidobacteriota bacterium]REK42631.1 MAG: VWA domain-containing protein [Acidobacteriota bacterium]